MKKLLLVLLTMYTFIGANAQIEVIDTFSISEVIGVNKNIKIVRITNYKCQAELDSALLVIESQLEKDIESINSQLASDKENLEKMLILCDEKKKAICKIKDKKDKKDKN